MIFNSNTIGALKRTRTDKSGRPAARPEMAPADWLLEALALIGLMVLAGFAIYQYPGLPEMIPSHFNSTGTPDDYAAKDTFWLLPGISLFIYILLSLISRIPQQFNYAVKITPENALKQYAMAIRLIRYLKAALIWMFFFITRATAQVTANDASGTGMFFIPVMLGGIFIPLIIYLVNSHRHR
ncbi:MAG: DUF1648 domain-containing protein [Bacteroidetes bacterium]|nr:DUF1648 domain-containing protein [Bacteroidota bacterium]